MNLRPPGYEPGELPDCSTPRRGLKYSSTASIAAMLLIVWISLGVVLVSLMGGALYVFLQVRSLWRAFKRFRSAADGLMRELTGSLERLSTNAEALGSETPRLGAALERLRHSLARAAVLRAAVDDVRDSFGRLTAVYPRK